MFENLKNEEQGVGNPGQASAKPSPGPDLPQQAEVDDIFADTDAAPDNMSLGDVPGTPKAEISTRRVGLSARDSSYEEEDDGKKSKVFTIVVAVMVLIIVGLLGFLVYNKFFKADDEPQIPLESDLVVDIGDDYADQVEDLVPEDIESDEVDFIPLTPGGEDPDLNLGELEGDIPGAIDQDPAPLLLVDSDGDGLYDREEIILGTDENKADTDGDGYSDREEIMNTYNPVGDGSLSDNPSIATYNSQEPRFSILYPNTWNLSTSDPDYTLSITTDDRSTINVSTQPNLGGQDIISWHADNVLPVALDGTGVQTASSWQGLMSRNGQDFYLTDLNKRIVYIISYKPAISDQIAYPNIFKMIINSLTIL